ARLLPEKLLVLLGGGPSRPVREEVELEVVFAFVHGVCLLPRAVPTLPGQEVGKAFRLALHLCPFRPCQAPPRLDPNAPALVTPRAGDEAVHEERGRHDRVDGVDAFAESRRDDAVAL